MSGHKRSSLGGNQPISRHPLFPVIVALWFGALFGVGSIAIRPALIEHAVVALGIDRVIPMAAPPLGATTRILIALAMTGLGIAVGALLARRLVHAAPPTHVSRRRTTAAPRGEQAPVKDQRPAGRRRALRAEASDDHAESTPAQASDARILNVAEFDLDGFEHADAQAGAVMHEDIEGEAGPTSPSLDMASQPEAEDAPEPLNNNLFETYSRDITAPRTAETPEPGFDFLPRLEQEAANAPARKASEKAAGIIEPVEETQTPPSALTATAPAANSAEASRNATAKAEGPAASSGGKAAERIASAHLDDLSPVELLERLALAMAQRREQVRLAAVPAPAPAPAPEPARVEEALESEPAKPGQPLPFTGPHLAAETIAPAEAVEPDQTAGLDAAPVSEIEPAQAPEPASTLARIPVALRPVTLTDPENEDDFLPAYIPPRHIGASAANGGIEPQPEIQAETTAGPLPVNDFDSGEEADGEEHQVLEEGYSSLLDLSRSAAGREKPAQQFARIEEPEEDAAVQPVVIFPGEDARDMAPDAHPAAMPSSGDAPPPAQDGRLFDAPGKTDPQETERALRAALATLQRMSGVA